MGTWVMPYCRFRPLIAGLWRSRTRSIVAQYEQNRFSEWHIQMHNENSCFPILWWIAGSEWLVPHHNGLFGPLNSREKSSTNQWVLQEFKELDGNALNVLHCSSFSAPPFGTQCTETPFILASWKGTPHTRERRQRNLDLASSHRMHVYLWQAGSPWYFQSRLGTLTLIRWIRTLPQCLNSDGRSWTWAWMGVTILHFRPLLSR